MWPEMARRLWLGGNRGHRVGLRAGHWGGRSTCGLLCRATLPAATAKSTANRFKVIVAGGLLKVQLNLMATGPMSENILSALSYSPS